MIYNTKTFNLFFLCFKCVTQWFHFTCVGLNSAPKGKWYCPACVSLKKKKKEKQQALLTTTNGQSSLINHSNNSNDGKMLSTSNYIDNDDFDFKFQIPKLYSSNKQKSQQQQNNQEPQNDNNNFT